MTYVLIAIFALVWFAGIYFFLAPFATRIATYIAAVLSAIVHAETTWSKRHRSPEPLPRVHVYIDGQELERLERKMAEHGSYGRNLGAREIV